LPASTPELLAGAFTVEATLAPDADEQTRARVRGMLEAFVRAIDLGFFDDSEQRPAALVAGSGALDEDGPLLRLRFSAQNLPRASFTILAGMFVGHAQHLDAPVASASAKQDGSQADLLTARAPALSALGELPFAHDIPEEGPAHKSLRIWLDFQRPVPDAEKDRLDQTCAVWDSLVLGPFPAAGRPIGDSWIGPAATSFLLPDRLEHFSEDFESGPAAFDVLLRALRRLHARLPIASIEIE
jgi:hypothetical protein